jgi:hypothetical protein
MYIEKDKVNKNTSPLPRQKQDKTCEEKVRVE